MSRKKPKKLEEKFWDQIVKYLPEMFTKALAAYYELAGEAMEGKKVKEIAEYHRACRVAVAHLELLIKLAQWADVLGEKAGKETAHVVLTQQASAAVNTYERNETDIRKLFEDEF